MRDQASTLRNLIQRRSADVPSAAGERARIVAFTSGKGGVGKSNLALSVAVAMAQAGTRVCLLDANPGSSNLNLLCGLNCYWNFGHVLSRAKTLGEVILKGPAGINILSGAGGLLELANSPDLIEQATVLETAYDVLIFDTGTGQSDSARRFAGVADVTFVVTTPEPTAIADAYATLKAWQGIVPAMPEILVNRAGSAAQAQQILDRFAQTVELFLRCSAPRGCWVAEDVAIPKAVVMRRPFVEFAPDCAASHDVKLIAKRVCAGDKPIQDQTLMGRL